MKKQFIGTWELLSIESRDKEGNVELPLGRDISGILIYNETHMITITAGNSRPRFKAPDLMRGTDQEKLSACDRFVAYTSTYEIDEKQETITHAVVISFFPNWMGDKQVRYYSFMDDRLELSTPYFLINGKEQKVTLVWKKYMR